ncbi:ribonuclease Z [Marinilabilia salmonicolor]|uniref:ribonuclease Z n=1 Tax=Marinilabilia salmonicolor TaxID=989 RepID=UPI00029A6659|nr:ribonuclease Z [Marinilabilia salmonicolor]
MGISVTILGSNSALPTSERNPTAQVLNASGRFFLIDCGEGTQMQLRRNRVHFGKIDHVFISHLHGDHVFGLPGLISSFGLLGRTKDLHIHGVVDLETVLRPVIDYFSKELPFNIVFHRINPLEKELIYEDAVLGVSTFPVEHRIPTVGFLFREKPKERKINKPVCDFYNVPLRVLPKLKQGADFMRDNGEQILNEKLTFPAPPSLSYAFCTDTLPLQSVAEVVKGVDMLYHEATFMSDQEGLAKKTFHSTARQAAEIALEAGVKKLLIGHFSSRYRDLSPLLAEAREVFPDTEIAGEGVTFDI